jgi:hypothetical protein
MIGSTSSTENRIRAIVASTATDDSHRLGQTWGNKEQPGAEGKPFNRPTWAVFAPWGDLYVSDGYGQNWMHRFSAGGELLRSWGGAG